MEKENGRLSHQSGYYAVRLVLGTVCHRLVCDAQNLIRRLGIGADGLFLFAAVFYLVFLHWVVADEERNVRICA